VIKKFGVLGLYSKVPSRAAAVAAAPGPLDALRCATKYLVFDNSHVIFALPLSSSHSLYPTKQSLTQVCLTLEQPRFCFCDNDAEDKTIFALLIKLLRIIFTFL
jgi:hypothetical protein